MAAQKRSHLNSECASLCRDLEGREPPSPAPQTRQAVPKQNTSEWMQTGLICHGHERTCPKVLCVLHQNQA